MPDTLSAVGGAARMYTRALGDKKGITVAKALESILQQLHREYPTVDKSFPKMAISDRGGGGIDQVSGSGWGFQVTDMLKRRGTTQDFAVCSSAKWKV